MVRRSTVFALLPGAAAACVIALAAPAARAQDALSPAEIRSIQQTLDAKGYEPGPADGLMGRRTAAAIGRFQKDSGAPVDGKPSRDLLTRMQGGWLPLENQPSCSVWIDSPSPRQTATWSGSCTGGKAQGRGALTLRFQRDGAPATVVYDGERVAGKADGRGVLTLANGDRYEGGFRDDRFHGEGVYAWKNGDRYRGDFRTGRRDGDGVMEWASGARYEGAFRDGAPHGEGVMTGADGARYDGKFRDGLQSGHGVLTAADGARYDGDFEDGAMTGHGVMIFADGSTYEGGWSGGRPEGAGRYHGADGDSVTGDWSNGCLRVDGRKAPAATPAGCGKK